MSMENNADTVHGFICGPKLYEFDGWFFEFSMVHGPWPLRKDGNPRQKAGRVFWKMYNKFSELSEEKQKEHRVGGGCIPF